MDPVTHTLFGVAIGEAAFRPRLGRRAVIVSALAANLPDIDIVVLITGDPGAVILRRSFGHSLFLLPLWIAGLAWLFKKKYPDIESFDLLLIIGLNAAGHLLFDLINSFGVQLFWPFSLMRPELAIIFILDFILAGILAAPHLVRLSTAWRPRLSQAARVSLVMAALYLVGAFAARQRALVLLAREAGGGGFMYAFAEPLGPHHWRGVVKDEAMWRVYLIDVLRGTAQRRLSLLNDENAPPAQAARQTALGKRLTFFFKAPVWTVTWNAMGVGTATVYDLRFVSLTVPRGTPFQYSFDVGSDGGAVPREVKIW